MVNKREKQRGFGVVGAVVATGLTTMLALGVLNMVNAISKTGRVAAAAGETALLRTEIQNLLSLHPDSCARSLRTADGAVAKFDPDVVLPTTADAIARERYEEANNLKQIVLGSYVAAREGFKSGHFFVQSVYLAELDKSLRVAEQRQGTPVRTFVAILDIAVSLSATAGNSSQIRHIQIPLSVSTRSDSAGNKNEIVHCSVGGAGDRATTSLGSSGWITFEGSDLQPGSPVYSTWTGSKHSLEQLCAKHGYTTYTGACRMAQNVSGPSQPPFAFAGTVGSNFKLGYWALACNWGAGSYIFGVGAEIQCTK